MTRVLLLAIAALIVAPTPQARKPVCAADNAGLKLLPGFCALIVAESIGPSRKAGTITLSMPSSTA